MEIPFSHPYPIHPADSRKVAFFCMEYGVDQSLKTYAGGLGYLAGSYLRSAYELRLPVVAIGIQWTYGYYDQQRKTDGKMEVFFQEKSYSFLIDTGIRFSIKVSKKDVWVSARYLPPEIFGTAPLFLLTTDIPENDHLSRTISHRLYDSNPESGIAAAILLGEGGAALLEQLRWEPDLYHLNESHGLPLAFHLYDRFRDIDSVKKRLVFTNHTPEEAGNPKSSCYLLEKMGYFGYTPLSVVRELTGSDGVQLDHTLTALRLSGKANGVSAMHLQTLEKMWRGETGVCPMISITNAQHHGYWHDPELQKVKDNGPELIACKKQMKKELFEIIADQCGKIFNPEICTIVFAKRFAGYKRADIFFHDMDRFRKLIEQQEHPVQLIWAGKPYPQDYTAIGTFDKIVDFTKPFPNCAILTGYEMKLSRILKRGADIWLNVPRLTHEASGTSGMSAAMNGAVNLALPDGWFPEFVSDGKNGFVIPPCEDEIPDEVQDDRDATSLYDILEGTVLPLFYRDKKQWSEIIRQGMEDIIPRFDSRRMVLEYYEKLYASSSPAPIHPSDLGNSNS